MIRLMTLASIMLSLVAVVAQAADQPRYAASAQATRSGDKITVSIKIEEVDKEFVPPLGRTEVTTQCTPRIVLREGSRAQIIGEGPAPAVANKVQAPAANMGDIDSGWKVDVISIKGQDELLFVADFIENGVTVWAQATTVHVTTAAMDAAE